MAKAVDIGRVWDVKGGRVTKTGLDQPDIRGGLWISIRDAQRLFDRPRSAIELAMKRKLIRSYRRVARGPYPSVFVLFDDVETWSKRTPFHGRQKSYRDEPIFGLVKDPDKIRGGG